MVATTACKTSRGVAAAIGDSLEDLEEV